MADIETTLSLLPTEIEELRTRGYVFRSFLENKVNVLAEQWEEVQGRVPGGGPAHAGTRAGGRRG